MIIGIALVFMVISGIYDAIFLGYGLLIAYFVLLIIGEWKVFAKMGEPGWKSLIPFYNNYILYKRAWKSFWYFIAFALYAAASSLEDYPSTAVFASIVYIAAVVVDFKASIELSKSFGHGIPFAIGLSLLNPIFMMILGFNNDSFCHSVEYTEV